MRPYLNTGILNSIRFNFTGKGCHKMSSEIGTVEEISSTTSQSGLVIFLHGSGDTGSGAKAWVEMLMGERMAFRHLKVMFPTAPLRPYTPLNGELSHVWFNRVSIRPDVPEELQTIEPMAKEINKFIEQQVANGTPLNRIILGGFSMGGAMALHVGYRYIPGLAGIFTLSSFLNEKSVVYDDLQKRKECGKASAMPPLFMCHGERDDLVRVGWGEETLNRLTSLGVTAEFHRFPNMLHELKKKELEMLYSWINGLVKNDK
uniref:palmitoyl-protein hydrolase n=2 Tax=Graphocephala atropunctata TaxID=36148 RepID=A0A1B6KUS9_9HEMI